MLTTLKSLVSSIMLPLLMPLPTKECRHSSVVDSRWWGTLLIHSLVNKETVTFLKVKKYFFSLYILFPVFLLQRKLNGNWLAKDYRSLPVNKLPENEIRFRKHETMNICSKVKQYNKSKRNLGRKCYMAGSLVKGDELEEKEWKMKRLMQHHDLCFCIHRST